MHNCEFDDMYHTDENGDWVHKKGDGYAWAYCWICNHDEIFLDTPLTPMEKWTMEHMKFTIEDILANRKFLKELKGEE